MTLTVVDDDSETDSQSHDVTILPMTDPQCSECQTDQDCDDGLYCNGPETCEGGICLDGSTIDCSSNNFSAIATCDNDPDNNPFTWDWRNLFTSACEESTGECSTGDDIITHTCDMQCDGCGCTQDSDCDDQNLTTADTCNLDTCQCEFVCVPSEEICDNGFDDDCDGMTDEEDPECWICAPEATTTCSTGQLGICSAGIKTCGEFGTWGDCIQTHQATEEICDNDLDDDCDGLTDENDPDCQGGLTICKYYDNDVLGQYQEGTDTPLAWNMTIIHPDQSTSSVWTNATTGCVTIPDLPYGQYQITEDLGESWVRTYPAETSTQSVTMNASSTSPSIYFLNYQEGDIVVKKAFENIEGMQVVPEAFDFLLNGTQYYFNSNGNATITIPFGPYTITEVDPGDEWAVSTSSDCVGELNVETNGNLTCTITNTYIPSTGDLEICKYYDNGVLGQYENGTDTPMAWNMNVLALNGRSEGDSWQTGTNGETGCVTLSGLYYGDYKITEDLPQGWVRTYPEATSSQTVTLDSSSSSVYFLNYREEPVYTLFVSKGGSGNGKVTGSGIDCGVTCSDSYASGTAVSLTASALSNSTFQGWSGDCSGSGACNLVMNEDKNVTANFELVQEEDGGGGGGGGFFYYNPPKKEEPKEEEEEEEEEEEGEVLGEATTTEECGIYLFQYIKYGVSNDTEEVKKLQRFLNDELDLSLPVTGIYDIATRNAVDEFQLKYKIQVLKPWVDAGIHCDVNDPTGYVYKTTKRWINLIMCPTLNIPMPDLSSYDKANCSGYVAPSDGQVSGESTSTEEVGEQEEDAGDIEGDLPVEPEEELEPSDQSDQTADAGDIVESSDNTRQIFLWIIGIAILLLVIILIRMFLKKGNN